MTPTASRTAQSTATRTPYDTGNIELCDYNCGFEMGNMSGWTQVGGSFEVTGYFVRSGAYAVSRTSSTYAYFSRLFSIEQYSRYIDNGSGQVNANVFIAINRDENNAVELLFLDGSGNTISSISSGWVNISTQFYPFVQSANMPIGTRKIQLRVLCKRSAGNWTDMFVDDISVKVRFVK